MKRIDSVTGLKGIAILMIVLLHTAFNGQYCIDGYFYNQVILKLGIFVQLFFMLSAFGMCCGYYEKIKNNSINLNQFYSKRYKKILPFFAMIVLADLVVSGVNFQSLKEAFLDLTLIYGFLPKGNIEVVGIGWTLGVIFAFYILFPFFVFLLWNKRRAWFVLGVSLIIKFTCGDFFINDKSTVMVNIILWSTYFIVGGIIFLYKDWLITIIKGNRIIPLMLIAVATLTGIVNSLYWKIDYIGTIVTLVGFTLVLIYSISGKSLILESKFLQHIGKYCLEIYLSHMMIFRVLEKLPISTIIKNDIMSLIVMYLLTCLVTMGFSVIANRLISKVGNKINERINA